MMFTEALDMQRTGRCSVRITFTDEQVYSGLPGCIKVHTHTLVGTNKEQNSAVLYNFSAVSISIQKAVTPASNT